MTAVAMARRPEVNINTTELVVVTVLAVIDMVILAYDAVLLTRLFIK